ncbi:class I SAM-dependent methyltransferase [Paenibacillus chitinolyticus]|uniref:class I SAM-dependent methyltransferase n=1 Tax=Paenibacillus chitinolyticus TaxID=79263 RepID=UPI0036461494
MSHLYDEKYYSGNSNYQAYEYDTRFIQWAYDIKKYLNPSNVLEIGCAKGFLMRALRLVGVQSKGIDLSEYAILNADSLVKSDAIVASATEIPFQVTFDLVIAFDILEHIPEPEVFTAIDEICRLGKSVFLKMPHFYDPWDMDKTHVTLYPKSWWNHQFEKRGYKVVQHHEILKRFNYMGGMLYTKVELNSKIAEPEVCDIATDSEKQLFETCRFRDIF